MLVSKKAFEKNYVYLEPARPKGAANSAGESTFMLVRNGRDMTTRHIWQTVPAGPGQLAVGQVVVMFHRNTGHVYRAPETRKEAQSTRWWAARLVSVASADQGFVIVSGGYRVAPNVLRLVQGDDSPTVNVSPQVDQHFLSPDHWIVADRALGNRTYVYAHVAAAVQAPSAQTKNEGRFLLLDSGAFVWSAHAWKTRPATAQDIQVGREVMLLHRNQGSVYRAPKERVEALTTRWWIAKVVDTSELYKGVVSLAGGYSASLDGLRVAAQ